MDTTVATQNQDCSVTGKGESEEEGSSDIKQTSINPSDIETGHLDSGLAAQTLVLSSIQLTYSEWAGRAEIRQVAEVLLVGVAAQRAQSRNRAPHTSGDKMVCFSRTGEELPSASEETLKIHASPGVASEGPNIFPNPRRVEGAVAHAHPSSHAKVESDFLTENPEASLLGGGGIFSGKGSQLQEHLGQ
ncbi:hypothetical protein E4U54_004737 [Claviceps lovelessii]|nr:hypothetical protein E4U54_004737 [Claviceps lovelessii]